MYCANWLGADEDPEYYPALNFVGFTGHVGHASVRGLEKARYTKSILKDLNLA